MAIDMTAPDGAYPADQLPKGVAALLASIGAFAFASEMALRLLRRVMKSNDAGMNYVLDRMDSEDPATIRDCRNPEIREIHARNYRFAYADCSMLVRYARIWYADWSAAADRVRARVPLRFVQGDANCVLPLAPLEDYCSRHKNASFRVAEGAGQCLLYTHAERVVGELLALPGGR